jgi:hypothetical protein
VAVDADDRQASLGYVELDQVVLLDQCDRASVQGLGGDMSDARTAHRA